jgi:hypothetical protein
MGQSEFGLVGLLFCIGNGGDGLLDKDIHCKINGNRGFGGLLMLLASGDSLASATSAKHEMKTCQTLAMKLNDHVSPTSSDLSCSSLPRVVRNIMQGL